MTSDESSYCSDASFSNWYTSLNSRCLYGKNKRISNSKSLFSVHFFLEQEEVLLLFLLFLQLWLRLTGSPGVYFGAAVSGLVAGVIIGQSTEYFTSDGNKPTQGIAKQALQGPATVIIEGMAVGMFSTWIPVITIVAGIIAAYGFAGGFHNFAMGVYGIGFAAVGMLSTLGVTLATDAFGPIADNAGGNAEMSELPKEVRERTDALDGLGNTTAATGKGFAIGSAALTALALMAAYMEEVRLWLGRLIDKAPEGFKQIGDTLFYNSTVPSVQDGQTAVNITTATIKDFVSAYDLSLFNPILLGGLFIGAMMAFLFSAMSMKAVGRAAGKMVDEVRRQFREIPGIMEGKAKPEYAKCVEISTAGAQSEMLVPVTDGYCSSFDCWNYFRSSRCYRASGRRYECRFCSCKYA